MARPGKKVIFVEAPIALALRLERVAEANDRSRNQEAIRAIKRHLSVEEPVVRELSPEEEE